jgi:hypothetical protein
VQEKIEKEREVMKGQRDEQKRTFLEILQVV